jgi:hypothetical protein
VPSDYADRPASADGRLYLCGVGPEVLAQMTERAVETGEAQAWLVSQAR